MSITQIHPTAALAPEPSTASPRALDLDVPRVEIVIPVYNEQHVLAGSLRALHSFMRESFPDLFRITVADNASTDGTLDIAREMMRELEEVRVIHLDQKGRGRALRAAWSQSEAEVVAYMDVDLSTDLAALPALLEPLLEGHADVAIGTRLAPGAEVVRGLKRELISRTYNILLRLSLGVGFSDAQCGFKAARRAVVAPLLEEIEDGAWFFDTELLCLAQRSKLSIQEVPVHWVEDTDSRVAIARTALEDLRGIWRLHRSSRLQTGEAGQAALSTPSAMRSAPCP
jgi:glycosyltransferase involved in cell wall biosynthesis